ncbi:hypothetical protein [Sphingomonas aracearum]|uniref:Uncharacterized protein n=1 Tax=Sphingomonas aracearum TaxID=2283317 RepID=A0A369VYM5_9SPHN|nr:hypothetical protein [Sphingomonas aracearum]RDE07243.1 hypothetical protein DVW87_06325 [Sphingomonas aracearum]
MRQSHASGHPVIEGDDPPEGWGWRYLDVEEVDLPDKTPQIGPSRATSDVPAPVAARQRTRGRTPAGSW